MNAKQNIDLTQLPETKLPMGELTHCFNEDGHAIAFEEKDSLMLVMHRNENVFKKRVNKDKFKEDL